MTNRARIQLIAATVVAVFAGGIWLSGGQLHSQWLRFYGAAVFLATIALSFWEAFIWRLPPVQRIQGVPRNVRGTWKGTLTSLWIDPDTSTPQPPKTAYLVIRQRASSVSVTLLTYQSRSSSFMGQVDTVDGRTALAYSYRNWPSPLLEDHSRIYHGSALLDVSGQSANRLVGRYWTDRDSRGELRFEARSKTAVDDFEACEKLFDAGTADCR
jgi:hypothetical protein